MHAPRLHGSVTKRSVTMLWQCRHAAQEQDMARKKQGSAGDFVDIVALLPWWAGVALALVGYLVLHRLAGIPQGTMQAGHSSEFI